MRAFWVDRETNMAHVVNTDGGLGELYDMCHCRCIDIAVVSVGGMKLNAVVDDECLLKAKPEATVFDSDGVPMLFGSVVFFGMDRETCDLAGLTNRQIDALLGKTGWALMTDNTQRCVTIADRR